MTEEERKAKDAARKREAYARRKQAKAEAIANPASIPPGVLYTDKPSHPLADEPALLADAILNSYARDFSNANALLKHILAHLIRIEIALGDRK